MANNTHTQIRENPGLQRMPTNQAEWRHFMNELQKWVADVDVNGRFTTDRLMPQVLLGNMGTVQTSLPVTATDAGASVTVNIASHVVQRTAGAITYSAGSITGLAYDTTYYIYADDPNFAGGSVTYLATTDKADITANIGRYFVSEVTTPAASGDDKTGGVGAGFAVLEEDLTNLTELQSSSPTYTVTNNTTDRTHDSNEASAGAGIAVNDASATLVPTLTEHNALVNVVLSLADVVGTMVEDFQTKNVFGS